VIARISKIEYRGNPVHRQTLPNLISEYASRYPAELETVARFQRLVDEQRGCFERSCWVGHITGSAWLVNPAGTHVLLTHHRKLGRWLQLGGHSDGDPDTLRVALKEAQEESGLEVRALIETVFDLDVHEIPARGKDPAHHHFDVRFALVADHEQFAVSEESLELAWVSVDGLEAYSREESVLRMARKWVAYRAAIP